MIDFIPFKPEHIDQIKLRESHEAKASIMAEGVGPQIVKTIAAHGQALTIADGNEILAVVTWFVPRAGVIDIGMYAAQGIYERPVSYLRFAVKRFKTFLKSLEGEDVRRIQTLSFPDVKHDRWMRGLGFECEGTMRRFAPDGRDMRLWAIIREVNHG